jgi:hypothetical protein
MTDNRVLDPDRCEHTALGYSRPIARDATSHAVAAARLHHLGALAGVVVMVLGLPSVGVVPVQRSADRAAMAT